MTKKRTINKHQNKKKQEHDDLREKSLESKKKKKVRLSSKLSIHVPISHSLMLILPSFVKSAYADVDSNTSQLDGNATPDAGLKSYEDQEREPNEVTPDNPVPQGNITTKQLDEVDTAVKKTTDAGLNHSSRYLSVASHPQVHYLPPIATPSAVDHVLSPTKTANTQMSPPIAPVTFVAETIKGKFGELHVDVDGKYVFVLNHHSIQYIALQQNQHGTDPFTLHLSNGATLVVQIPVIGGQDTPTISGDLLGFVSEDHNVNTQGFLQANGKIDVVDPDLNESAVTPETLQGHYGSLSIDAQGHWQYQAKNSSKDIQALINQTSLHETFVIHAKDGTPQTINITIGGNNDNAIVTGQDSDNLYEDLSIHAHGKLDVVDPDVAQDHFLPEQLQGSLGALSMQTDGHWAYVLDNTNPKVQTLGKGSTATDIITVHSADGTPHQVTITVNGTNDMAVIGGTNTGVVTEESQLKTSGTLTVNDVDAGEAHFSSTDIIGSLGTLHLTDNGDWTYELDNTNSIVQALGKGSTATDTITVHSADGTPHQVTITVNGTNDTAVIAGNSTANVTEDKNVHSGQLHADGQLIVTDIDGGEAQFQAESLQGQFGTLSINDLGHWTYTADNSQTGIQRLKTGESVTDTVIVHSVDGTEQKVTVTINGTDDKAIIAGVDTGSVNEGHGNYFDMSPDYGKSPLTSEALYADGKLTVFDADAGQSEFDVKGGGYSYQGQFGRINLHEDGTWHYMVDIGHHGFTSGTSTTSVGTTIDQLGDGQSLTDTITVYSKDGTSHDIVVTIHGDNDKPYCSSEVQLGSGKEDTAQILTLNQLLQNTVDVDANDASKLSIENLHADHGSIALNSDGTFTFTPTQDYNGQVHFTYDVKDAHCGVTHTGATTTLTATRDAAIITEVSTGNVIEDGSHRSYNNGVTTELATGQLHVTDPDSGENKFQFSPFGESAIHDPFNGMLRIDRAGGWQYSVDNSKLQHLAEGQTETVVYRIHSLDGTAYDLHIDVVGTNDTPTVTQIALNNGTEDTQYQMQTSQFGFQDIDSGDTLHSISFTDMPPASQGKFVCDGHDVVLGQRISAADIGKLQFIPAHDFNGDIQFKYTVNDGHTDSLEATNTLHFNNTADTAIIAGTDTGDITEDSFYGMQWLITKGQLTITDGDVGEEKFDPVIHAQNHSGIGYDTKLGGHVILSQDGSWQYQIDNFSPKVQKLAAGETTLDSVTIHSVDGTPHDIHITIHGTNDAPVLTVSQSTSTTGTLTETDIDINDTHSFSVVTSAGQFGDLSVDPTSGAYVYTPHSSVAGMTYNAATHTYHGLDVFEVKVADNHGGEDSKFLTFDANGQVSVISGQQPTISARVPNPPMVTTAQPSFPAGINTAPHNAVTVDLATSSDSGKSQTDNLTKDNTPTITGHTDIPYSQVTIYDGSTPIGKAVSDGSGHYRAVVSGLTDGVHDVTATALAPSSTLPATSSLLSVQVDTAITPLTVTLTHDTGNSAADLITHDGALTVSGQELGATIEYSVDNGHTWTSGFSPQQGSNTVSVRQTDVAGNISPSRSVTFTLDNSTSAPIVSLNTDSGSSSSDKVTAIGSISVTGTEQGSTVEYSIDNGAHWSQQFNPVEGQNTVHVRQTDVAGNISPTTTLAYILDTQTDIRVNSTSVDRNGHGMYVQVYLPKDSQVTHLEITSDGGGAPLVVDLQSVQQLHGGSSVSHPDHQYVMFSGIDLSSLPDGHLNVHVVGTDQAGNTASSQTLGHYSAPLVLDTSAHVTDDSNTAIEDSTQLVAGNVLSNDSDADSVTTTGDIQGTYGVFHLHSDGRYTYNLNNQLSVVQQLNPTSTPLVDSIPYTASDNHGNHATAHLVITIQGTDDNQAPVVTGQTVSINEDTTRTFSSTEFGYHDHDGDALQFITINSLPAHGLLLLNGILVTTSQQISKADLDAGYLTFTPIKDENGAHYAQFSFTANDGHQDSTSATMVLNVNAVNDAPTVGSSFISSPEDQPHAFTAADFKYSDVDGDALNHLTITNVAHGVLTLKGHTVNIGDVVSASDVSSLVFTPTHNYFSSGISGLGTVQFTANDGHTDSKEGSIFINITGVADPATFSGDSVGQTQEDNHIQASGVLTATDPDGTQGFTAVQGGAGIIGSKGYGHAHIDSNGHWSYNLYNNHPLVQQLAEGQTDSETITVQSADGTTHDILITITGTNDLPTVSEKQPSGIAIGTHSITEDSGLSETGQLVIDDIDGDTTNVTIDPNHTASFGHVQYNSQSGTWVYKLDNNNVKVDALNNGDTLTDKFTLLVDDGHGGIVSKEVSMTINGHTDTPPLPTLLTPPTITGGAGHQDLHSSIGIPPIIHQGVPSPLTGWGISNGHGQSVTALHGAYGTLHINPATGAIDYDYAPSSGVIKTHTGGNYGSGTDETDTFVLTLGGSQNSHVEVHLHLHSQSVHGNSGHHVDQTRLTGMDISPITPPPPPPIPGMTQSDEPDSSALDTEEVTFTYDDFLPGSEHADADSTSSQHTGASAYLDALGIQLKPNSADAPSVESSVPQDMDLVFHQADEANQANPIDENLDDALSHGHDIAATEDNEHHHNDVDGLPDIDPNH